MTTNNPTILVIGDVMLDKYVFCKFKSPSPEAPISVFTKLKEEFRLGGAANVACNLKSIACNPILISISGNDNLSKTLIELLEEKQIENQIIRDTNRKTTIKERLIENDYEQLLRLDEEDSFDISDSIYEDLKSKIDLTLSSLKVDGIIVQDYNKGMITSKLIELIKTNSLSYKIPIFVDPKEKNFLQLSDCSVFKPNKRELSQYLGKELKSDKESIDDLVNQSGLKCENLILTLAEKGIYFNNGLKSGVFPGQFIKNADVSGAGDTVISIIAYLYIKGYSIDKIAQISNICGAMVCERKGVAQINKNELENIINSIENES